MAILKDLEVSIVVGDHEIREYEDEDSQAAPDFVTKYVEATSGDSFAINMRVLPTFHFTSHGLQWSIYVDGCYVERQVVMFDEWLELNMEWDYKLDGIARFKGKKWTHRPFQFQNVIIMDDPTSLERMRKHPALSLDIGKVIVKAFRMTNDLERDESPSDYDDIDTLENVAKASEGSLKGTTISSSINLGKERNIKAPEIVYIKYTDGRDTPIATFTFKYRSLKALKDLLLVPRTPSPPPLEDRPVDSLTAEEMKVLIQKLKARTIKTEKGVKRERTEDDGDMAEVVHSRPSKKARVLDAEGAIVISDDEDG